MSLLRVQRQHSDGTWKQTDQILSGVFTEEIMEKMTFSSHLWSRQARRTKLNGGKCTGWSGLNIQIQAQRNRDGLSDIRLTDWKESHWNDEPCHLAGDLNGCWGDSLPWGLWQAPKVCRQEGLAFTPGNLGGQTQHIKPHLPHSRCSLNATFSYYVVTGHLIC